MGILIGIPLLAALAILQSSILSHLQLLNGRPDLVLLAVLAWSLAGRPVEAMVWALVGGAFLDMFSGQPMGSTSMALIVIAYIASWLEGRLWGEHVFVTLGVVLAGSALFYLLLLAALLLTGRSIDVGVAITRVVLPSTFLNLVLAMPAAQLAAAVQRSISPQKVSI